MKLRIATCQVDEVIGVDDQGLDAVFLPQRIHLAALASRQFIWLPLPRAGRKNLKGIAAQPVGPLRGSLHSAGSGGVNANPPRRHLGWRAGRRHFEDVLLLLHGARHGQVFSVLGNSRFGARDLFKILLKIRVMRAICGLFCRFSAIPVTLEDSRFIAC